MSAPGAGMDARYSSRRRPRHIRAALPKPLGKPNTDRSGGGRRTLRVGRTRSAGVRSGASWFGTDSYRDGTGLPGFAGGTQEGPQPRKAPAIVDRRNGNTWRAARSVSPKMM